jgi:hypothetical protein
MKKVLLLDEAIMIAIKNGLSVTQVRDLFLTPDLTPTEDISECKPNVCGNGSFTEK